MRNIPAQLQNHLDGEVISLTKCISITKKDGSVVRLTTHDRPLDVGNDTYYAHVAVDISALESSDDLSVDNAEITIGLDGTIVKEEDILDGLYENAEFSLFAVNWSNVAQGVIHLKSGTLGDATISGDVSVTIQIRGLTHAFQRGVVDRYSPTCRVSLGGEKCGVPNLPTRVRRPKQKCKTYDWFLVPETYDTVSLTNSSFEDDGEVANGSSGISGWLYGIGSFWRVNDSFSVENGLYYLEGGDDSSGPSSGAEFTLYKDLTLSDMGLTEVDVDLGKYSVDISVLIAGTSETFKNSGRVYLELFDEEGLTLKRVNSLYLIPDYHTWQGIGVTDFILPRTRIVRVGLQARKDNGNFATVAFDSVNVRTWENSLSTFGNAAFRTTLILGSDASSGDSRRLVPLVNPSFEQQGAIPNSSSGIAGWSHSSGAYWSVVDTAGIVSPHSGSWMLRGGDNGSTNSSQVYTLFQDYPILSVDSRVTDDNLNGGWYFGSFEINVARLSADSSPNIRIAFLDSSMNVLVEYESGYAETEPTNTWFKIQTGGKAPSGARHIRILLDARSGSGSSADVVFDSANAVFTVTAYSGVNDSPYGSLSFNEPSYEYTENEYTVDGQVLVQARPVVFDYGVVTDTVDSRTFESSSITETPQRMFSGKIIWLSGGNAGKVSFIRIWDDTTKLIKMYDKLRQPIQIGDRFVWALGCTKTIDVCADTFGNAVNFRGEPYLPGTAKVIEFMSSN